MSTSYLVKDYCYTDLNMACKASVFAGGSLVLPDRVFFPSDASSISPNLCSFDYRLLLITSGTLSNRTITNVGIDSTSCPQNYLGPFPQSGLMVPFSDAVLASWLVVAVWASAYFFKIARNAARGY